MDVKELIEDLKERDQDLEVWIAHPDYIMEHEHGCDGQCFQNDGCLGVGTSATDILMRKDVVVDVLTVGDRERLLVRYGE